MSFELTHLFAGAVIYLALLFVIAFAAERGWIPDRVVRHPATYILSLGVYAIGFLVLTVLYKIALTVRDKVAA